MKFSSKLLASSLLIVALTACGQSGPLYLPGDPSEVQSLPTQLPDTPPPDEDDEDEESVENKSDNGGS